MVVRWFLSHSGSRDDGHGSRGGCEGRRPGGSGCLAMVCLLGVTDQVVLATKLLRAELALEVALARVHHQVTLDILAREERALAAVALETALGGRLDET